MATTKKSVTFSSQVNTPSSTSALTTTTSPFTLLCSDVALIYHNLPYLPGIMLPMTPYGSGPLDELYPSPLNLFAMSVHAVLCCVELFFVLSVPFFVFFVGVGCILYSAFVALVVYIQCLCLNGSERGLMTSNPDIMRGYDEKKDEVWVFVNGVAVG